MNPTPVSGQMYHLVFCMCLQVADDVTKNRMARMAASASWGRQEWSAMARYVQLLPRDPIQLKKKFWLEFQLEKSLEIPYNKKMYHNV